MVSFLYSVLNGFLQLNKYICNGSLPVHVVCIFSLLLWSNWIYFSPNSSAIFLFVCFVIGFLYILLSVHCELSVYTVNIFDVFSLLSV